MPASMRGQTKMVLHAISRLSTKLNQLLQFSRPGILEGASQDSSDIKLVIEDVLRVAQHEAQKRHVRLASRIVEGASTVDASAEALHDVISNLVLNAIQASLPDGEVIVQLSWLGLECLVTVEDEGPGIPADLKEKVLQPFFTTKPQGTGLGLAIVAKRVAELGGELKVISPASNGHGTRCEVRIWPSSLRRNNAASRSGE